MKSRIAFPIAFPLIFSCCVPCPQKADSSPHIRGRVVDSLTHRPVAGARVAITNPPPGISCGEPEMKERLSTAVKTDADGVFDLPAHRHMLLWMTIGICGSEDPEGPEREYSEYLKVSRKGCVTRDLSANGPMLRTPQPNGDVKYLKDVRLVSLSAAGPAAKDRSSRSPH